MLSKIEWEKFKSDPKYKNLNIQEVYRQYFIRQSDRLIESNLSTVASSSAGSGGGGNKSGFRIEFKPTIAGVFGITINKTSSQSKLIIIDETNGVIIRDINIGSSSNTQITGLDNTSTIYRIIISETNINSISITASEFALLSPITNNLNELTIRSLSSFIYFVDLPKITTLNLSSGNLTTFDPTIPLPNSLTRIDLSNNKLTSFTPTIPLPTSLNWLSLRINNQISSSELDKTLIYLNSSTFNVGPKSLDVRISGTPPGPSGLSAITSLQAKGWSVMYVMPTTTTTTTTSTTTTTTTVISYGYIEIALGIASELSVSIDSLVDLDGVFYSISPLPINSPDEFSTGDLIRPINGDLVVGISTSEEPPYTPLSLLLLVNSVLTETVPVSGGGSYVISSSSISIGDSISVTLTDSP